MPSVWVALFLLCLVFHLDSRPSIVLFQPAISFSKHVEPPGGEFAPKCLIGDPAGDNVFDPSDSYEVDKLCSLFYILPFSGSLVQR